MYQMNSKKKIIKKLNEFYNLTPYYSYVTACDHDLQDRAKALEFIEKKVLSLKGKETLSC